VGVRATARLAGALCVLALWSCQANDPGSPLAAWPVDATPMEKALIAGSWRIDEQNDFEREWIDEQALRVAYTNRRAGRRKWMGIRGDSDVLPVDALIRDREGPAVAYVYALVQRDVPEPFEPDAYEFPLAAVLHLRHRGRARLWLDGERVLDVPAPPPGEVGQAAALVTLTDAFDVILVKIARGSPELGHSMDLQIRLSLPNGAAIPQQLFNTMRPSHLPPDIAPELLR